MHIEHGIARYTGLVKMGASGAEREYLQLEYAEGDRLYVPIEQTDRVAATSAPARARPRCTASAPASGRAPRSGCRRPRVELARELLALYAAREAAPGHAFSPDSTLAGGTGGRLPLRRDRQTRCAPSTRSRPTWRTRAPWTASICGDVGYGKTEVALRAAFKAVMDGKQVAVLVPTTVLAQQHFNTFRERMAAFPVTVEMLSRFRSRQGAAAHPGATCAAGSVDIIIGTHRLLQKDVQFKDLGLVVVDEEQRFGVRAQGAPQAAAPRGRRADADRHADPAHAAHGAGRRARHERDRDAARRAPADQDLRHRLPTTRWCAR